MVESSARPCEDPMPAWRVANGGCVTNLACRMSHAGVYHSAPSVRASAGLNGLVHAKPRDPRALLLSAAHHSGRATDALVSSAQGRRAHALSDTTFGAAGCLPLPAGNGDLGVLDEKVATRGTPSARLRVVLRLPVSSNRQSLYELARCRAGAAPKCCANAACVDRHRRLERRHEPVGEASR